jgi:hypothetical protein
MKVLFGITVFLALTLAHAGNPAALRQPNGKTTKTQKKPVPKASPSPVAR